VSLCDLDGRTYAAGATGERIHSHSAYKAGQTPSIEDHRPGDSGGGDHGPGDPRVGADCRGPRSGTARRAEMEFPPDLTESDRA
jgi:hypothetical protein